MKDLELYELNFLTLNTSIQGGDIRMRTEHSHLLGVVVQECLHYPKTALLLAGG